MIEVIREILFWVHIALILLYISIGFFLSLPIIILIVAGHRMQFVIIGDCALSRIQKFIGELPQGTDFLQFAAKKLFNKSITQWHSKALDYLFLVLTLSIGFLRHL